MKGQYGDANDHHHPNLFGKLHQINRLQHHSLSLPIQPDFLLAGRRPTRDSQTSEEADSRSSPPTSNLIKTTNNNCSVTVGDGASIEVVRRPRGRPPGSKNKSKPAVSVNNEPEPGSMSPYILELPGGCDVVSSVNRFCRRRNTGLCVLTGSGVVANVTIRQPSTSASAVTFQGRFDVLSLSATILPPSADAVMAGAAANGFTISLGGPQGQVIGGMVVGPLLAAGTVYLIAASFNNPSFHRLPLEEEEAIENSATGGTSGSGEDGNQQQHKQTAAAAAESCGMSMFSPHLGSSDVIWVPTARQPPPRY
ncbi:AT-hook motif nuclear-localized protein 17-like [Impatiens glandulifera]|uniref:AT-hook motif nuclear-localized protein 17-like n=1 Tax=Impatiens glandulifera TaxID=253017 RepID=UPI001FB0CB27|nr:AT-hook motif nuclear-localized protein 17-like [Impatiens glandulifera]